MDTSAERFGTPPSPAPPPAGAPPPPSSSDSSPPVLSDLSRASSTTPQVASNESSTRSLPSGASRSLPSSPLPPLDDGEDVQEQLEACQAQAASRSGAGGFAAGSAPSAAFQFHALPSAQRDAAALAQAQQHSLQTMQAQQRQHVSRAPLASPPAVSMSESPQAPNSSMTPGRFSHSPLRSPPAMEFQDQPDLQQQQAGASSSSRMHRTTSFEDGSLPRAEAGSSVAAMPAPGSALDYASWSRLQEMQKASTAPSAYRNLSSSSGLGLDGPGESTPFGFALSNPSTSSANSSAPPGLRALHGGAVTQSGSSTSSSSQSSSQVALSSDGSSLGGTTPRSHNSGLSSTSTNKSFASTSSNNSAGDSPRLQMAQQSSGQQPLEYGAQRHRRTIMQSPHLQRPLNLRGGAYQSGSSRLMEAHHAAQQQQQQQQQQLQHRPHSSLGLTIGLDKSGQQVPARPYSQPHSPMQTQQMQQHQQQQQQQSHSPFASAGGLHYPAPSVGGTGSVETAACGSLVVSPNYLQFTSLPHSPAAMYSSGSDSSTGSVGARNYLQQQHASAVDPTLHAPVAAQDCISPSNLASRLNATSISSSTSIAPAAEGGPSLQSLASGGGSSNTTASGSVAPQKRGGGISCHHCKTHKGVGDLYFCTNALPGDKRCHKKYCSNCLKRLYAAHTTQLFGEGGEEWICPSCRGACLCAMCARKVAGIMPSKRMSKKKREAQQQQQAAAEAGVGVAGGLSTTHLASSMPDTPVPQQQMPPSSAAMSSTAVGAVPASDVTIEPAQLHQTSAQLEGAALQQDTDGRQGWSELQVLLQRQQDLQRQIIHESSAMQQQQHAQQQVHQQQQQAYQQLQQQHSNSQQAMQHLYQQQQLQQQQHQSPPHKQFQQQHQQQQGLPQQSSAVAPQTSPTQEQLRIFWNTHHPPSEVRRSTSDGFVRASSNYSHNGGEMPQSLPPPQRHLQASGGPQSSGYTSHDPSVAPWSPNARMDYSNSSSFGGSDASRSGSRAHSNHSDSQQRQQQSSQQQSLHPRGQLSSQAQLYMSDINALLEPSNGESSRAPSSSVTGTSSRARSMTPPLQPPSSSYLSQLQTEIDSQQQLNQLLMQHVHRANEQQQHLAQQQEQQHAQRQQQQQQTSLYSKSPDPHHYRKSASVDWQKQTPLQQPEQLQQHHSQQQQQHQLPAPGGFFASSSDASSSKYASAGDLHLQQQQHQQHVPFPFGEQHSYEHGQQLHMPLLPFYGHQQQQHQQSQQ